MSRTRLPRLLDSNLKELDRLRPLRLSLTLNLAPLSTASMELPPEQDVKLRQMVELFTPHGSAGVFRVTAVQSSSGKASKVTLSHGLCTLSDAMLSGSGEAIGTAKDILEAILATQTTWTLGTCDTPDDTLTWSWDNSNALEALTDLMTELPGYYLAFDQSTLPWKLHVLKLTDADACECKLNRSMTGITIKEDDSQLCTRLTVPGVDTPMDADTISTWGVISRILEADPDLPQDMLLRAAQAYLEENKNPKLTISIDAVELARRTGDPFDRFTCGKMCRTSLDDGAPIHQRIVRLQYTDLIGSPDVCKITLAAAADTASTAIAGLVVDTTLLINKVSGNRKKLKLQAEAIELLGREITLKANQTIVDGLGAQLSQVSLDLDAAETALIAKAEKAELQNVNTRLSSAELYLFGAEGQGGLITQVYENSELIGQARVDLDATDSSVTLLGGKVDEQGELLDGAMFTLNGHESRIAAQANEIALKADQASLDLANGRIDGLANEIALHANDILTLSSGVDDNAAAITLANEKITANAKEIDANAERITANANAIALKADQASLDLANGRIDAQANEIALKADLITLDAYVKATTLEANYAKLTDLNSVRASISNLTSGLTTATVINSNVVNGSQINGTYGSFDSLTHNGVIVSQRNITMGGIVTVGKALSTGGELDLQHSHAVNVADDGTLQLGEVTAEGGNFNIADTQYYKNGVSAAYGNGYNVGFDDGKDAYMPTAINRTGYSEENKTVTVRALNAHQDLLTGQVIDATEIYNAGWNECRDAMTQISNLYTISQTAPGTLYMLVNGNYTSVGSSWVQVSSYTSAYRRPAAIA